MLRIHFVAIGLLLAASFAPEELCAASSVFLPSDSSTSGSSASPTLAQPPLVAVSAPSAPSLAQTPVPSTATPQTFSPITPFTKDEMNDLPLGSLPTRVIHLPDMSAALMKEQASMNLPYSQTISFSGKSFFGAKDVDSITTKLGLSRDKVASSCYLSARGILQTDKGGQLIGGGLSPQITVHYDGTIKNYMMMATALCTAGNNLPKGSGFLTEMGDHFVISLQQIKCDPPTRQVSGLIITYDGSGTSQCLYQ